MTLRPFNDLVRLDGRVAVVTGGGRGLGAAIARRLCEAGAAVVVADLDGDLAAETAADLREGASDVAGVSLDVRDAQRTRSVAREAAERFGSLDVWVNNAGVFPAAPPLRVPTELFEDIMAVNVLGTQHGCQAAAAQMIEAGTHGVIVNVGSVAGYRGHGAYSTSKWAVRGITQGLAAPLGRHGIRIVGVAPALVGTPGIDELREAGGPALQAALAPVANRPLDREPTADDVALAVTFLASDAAAFITGVTVPVDGGELAT